MRIWVAALGLLISYPAAAADWVKVVTGSNGDKLFVDQSSIAVSDDNVTVWVEIVSRPHRVAGSTIKDRTASIKQIWEFRCTPRMIRRKYYVAYDMTGGEIYSDSAIDQFDPVVPDSLGEAVMQ